jgi:hypothetical protein
MPDSKGIFRVLLKHFFRRFFDNDTIQIDGDTVTTVVRAFSFVAVPGLMFAFFMQNQYPQRTLAGRMEDQYLFVLLSFVAMGAVTIFEWEMLFPDRSDFLVLTPLPLNTRLLMASKGSALGCFLGIFLIGSGALGALMYPAICKGVFFRQLGAHLLAVGLAGCWISLSLLGLGALLRCLVSDRIFRILAPAIQTFVTIALVLLVVHYARYGASIQVLLLRPELGRWLPPVWFLALYDRVLYGAAAPVFAVELTPWAVWAVFGAALLVLVSYPGAWFKMRRRALEGEGSQYTAGWGLGFERFLDTVKPQELAMFRFIAQSLGRSARYKLYLAMYTGVALAFALSCGVVVLQQTSSISARLSTFGLHAVFPLLCFWTVSGLRVAFGFPIQLSARWIFAVSGTDPRYLAAAAKRWCLLITLALLAGCLLLLTLSGWNLQQLIVQTVCGVCLAVLFTDAFFQARSVPLTQPRMPGRSNFALILTLYIGALPPSLLGIVVAELHFERKLWQLAVVVALTAAMHCTLKRLQAGPMESEEEMEGYEGEFQVLNLS